MTPTRHATRPGLEPGRPTLGKSRRPRAGGRVGSYLAEAAASALDVQARITGRLLDAAAVELEAAAELARWLAAVTRACP